MIGFIIGILIGYFLGYFAGKDKMWKEIVKRTTEDPVKET